MQLGTVQFHAASTEPKPPGLPGLQQSGTLTPPRFPRQDSARGSGEQPRHSLAQSGITDPSITDHEAYGDYPPGAQSPASARRVSQPPSLPAIDSPYGGLEDGQQQQRYSEFGASPSAAGTADWRHPIDVQDPDVHDYEYAQQREMDEQRQREAAEAEGAASSGPGWQPLKVRHSRDYGGTTLHDGPSPQSVQDTPPPRGASLQDRGVNLHDTGSAQGQTSPSLNLNSDAFEPLSFDRSVPSRTSAYYSPDPMIDRDEVNQTPVPGFAGAAAQPATEEFRTPQASPPLPQESTTTDDDNYRHSRPFSHLPSPSQIHDEELPAPPPVPSLPPAVTVPASAPPTYDTPSHMPPMVTIPADNSAYAEDQEPTPVVSVPPERTPDRYIPPVAPPAPELDPTASLVSVERDSFYGSNRGSLAPSIATSAPSHYTRESAPSQYTRDSYVPSSDDHNRDSMISNGTATEETPVVTIPAERAFQPAKPNAAGKISAAAFRRAPRSSTGTSTSTDDYDPSSPPAPMGPRRLPQPPAPTQQAAVPSTPSPRSSWEAAPPYGGDDNNLR